MIRMTLHSIIILVDRIACSDYEEERTLHPGYKKFLASRGGETSITDITHLPQANTRFTDRCHVFNWELMPCDQETNELSLPNSASADRNGEPIAEDYLLADSNSLASDDQPAAASIDIESKQMETTNATVVVNTLPQCSFESALGDDVSLSANDSFTSRDRNDDSEEHILGQLVSPTTKTVAAPNSKVINASLRNLSSGSAGSFMFSDRNRISVLEDSGVDELTLGSREEDDNFANQSHNPACASRPLNGGLDTDSEDDDSENGDTTDKGDHLGSLLAKPLDDVHLDDAAQDVSPIIEKMRKKRRNTPVAPREIPTKKPRSSSLANNMEAAEAEGQHCHAGNECKRPGSSTILTERRGIRKCNRCQKCFHLICLRVRFNTHLCNPCFPSQQREDRERALASIRQKREEKNSIALRPPSELMDFRMFLPCDITKEMKTALDAALVEHGFKSEDEIRELVSKHYAYLRETQVNTGGRSRKDHKKVQDMYKANREMKATIKEWKKCRKRLRLDFLRRTRCIVHGLAYDAQRKCFNAQMEWEEKTLNLTSDKSVPVVISEQMTVNDEWVKANYTESTYVYLKKLALMAVGKFMPVPHAHVMLDTRQVSHFKWSAPNDQREGCWVVKFALSDDTEIMSEDDLLQAVSPQTLSLAKAYAANKKGFVPIPPGNTRSSTEAAHTASKVEIHFQQHDRKTCVYSSFASALWSVGIFHLAFEVAAKVCETEGDPFVLKNLASFVYKYPFWLGASKIKNAMHFDIFGYDLSSSLAVVVLMASDGAINHAVTVHDGLIFDANERYAIPLSQANLDLMCSTESRSAAYKCIAYGYLFRDTRKQEPDGITLSKLNLEERVWNIQRHASGL